MLATITPITPAIKLIGLYSDHPNTNNYGDNWNDWTKRQPESRHIFHVFFLNQITANAVGMYWKKRKTTDSSANCSNDPLSRKAMVSKPEK